MAASVVQEKMLYCPKCQQTYEEGSQRFCNNDGGRLQPVSNAEKAAAKPGGVFTNLLTRNLPNPERDEKLASIPRFIRVEPETGPEPSLPRHRLSNPQFRIIFFTPIRMRSSSNSICRRHRLRPLRRFQHPSRLSPNCLARSRQRSMNRWSNLISTLPRMSGSGRSLPKRKR